MGLPSPPKSPLPQAGPDFSAEALAQGFESFSEAAQQLQVYYQQFEEKVAALNEQVARKNQELEQNLREKDHVQNYLSNILEGSAVGILVTDLDGRITSANRMASQLIGMPVEDLLQTPFREVLPLEVTSWNDGEGVQRQVREHELNHFREGTASLTLNLSITSMSGANDETLGWIVNLQDITELKHLEAEAERKNRLTGMGEMAANVAHQIRNPLGSIELFTSLLQQEMPSERAQTLLQHLSAAAQSMNQTVSNFLEYTQPQPLLLTGVADLQEVLQESLRFLRQLVEYNNIRVHTDLHAQVLMVQGSEERLRQVFRNLLLNAVQAMVESGDLHLSSCERTITDAETLAAFGQEARNRTALPVVEVVITDTGSGMAPEVLEQAFEPFFSTQELGAGLGLAIVRNILEAHGAVIAIDSTPDSGTRVTVRIPQSAPACDS
ncbi:MAG: ATP-binding protein [SAR324 cluster bacterium]|jgi:PAS domain S-box-containing protein|nr:ATP-binding protein [SAR324 cluster bacterium]